MTWNHWVVWIISRGARGRYRRDYFCRASNTQKEFSRRTKVSELWMTRRRWVFKDKEKARTKRRQGQRQAYREQPEPKWGLAGKNGQVGHCQTGALDVKLRSPSDGSWRVTGLGLLREEEALGQSNGRRICQEWRSLWGSGCPRGWWEQGGPTWGPETQR